MGIAQEDGPNVITRIADVFDEVRFSKVFAPVPYLFRGQAKFDWGITPNLYRSAEPSSFNVISEHMKEEIMLQMFFARSEPYLNAPRRSFLRDRILAQHYGVPTRLLDWSRNPLIALYFAVEDDRYDCDGAVYYGKTNGGWTGAIDTASESQVSEAEFVSLVPPSLDLRITAQGSILTIQNQKNTLGNFVTMDSYEFKNKSSFVKKFRVPKASKPEIYKELMMMGITHTSIYPSLQGVGDGVRLEFKRAWGISKF